MSQWVHATGDVLKNVDMSILEQACNNLRLGLDYSIHHISNTWGQDSVNCGLRSMDCGNEVCDFGFRTKKTEYGTDIDVVGDFFYSDYRDANDFVNTLSREYRKVDIIDKAEMNGYTVEEETVNKKGQIELTLTAY
jgi:hypothetical protein